MSGVESIWFRAILLYLINIFAMLRSILILISSFILFSCPYVPSLHVSKIAKLNSAQNPYAIILWICVEVGGIIFSSTIHRIVSYSGRLFIGVCVGVGNSLSEVYNLKTTGWSFMKLHIMTKLKERKCRVKETELYFY